MKHFNLILGLTILMNVVGAKTFAHDFEMENADGVIIYYDFINDGSQLMVTYKGNSYNKYSDEYSGIVVIPESVTYSKKKYSVSSISDDAFRECSRLTSVTIPNSVTTIGQYAFKDCSGLTSITIPNSVESIGDCAFQGCKGLTSITIPNSVTSIGNSVFGYCSGLTSITIPNSVTSIGNSAFFSCSGLTSITIPNSVESIGDCAFGYCSGLTSVNIGNSVTSIVRYAFCECPSLTSIIIPNSVMSIGYGTFYGCSGLTSIRVEPGNAKYDSRENCNAIIETASNILVAGCKNTVIPNSVTNIGDGAFLGCKSLTSITIPNSVTSIGNSAFYNCSSLTSIIIPNSMTSIGNSAFMGCSGLTSITIPNSVTSIDDCAFYGCSKLTCVTALNPTPVAISQYVFSNRTNATLYVPIGSKGAYEAADYWKDFKEIIEIDPSGIDEISIQGDDCSNIDQERATWYTLDGKRINKPQRGLNILRMKDGTTKKVVIK